MPPLPFPWAHRRWSDQASAFVDDELDAAARVRFERHLAGCARCAADVEALRSVKLLVSRMPEVAAPRSFRLTPQMVAAPAPPVRRAAPVALRTAQFAAGLAVIAFVAVLTIDLTSSTSTNTSTSQRETLAAGANVAPKSAQDSAAAGSAQLAPNGATPVPTMTPGIVAPNGGGVGGAGAPCSAPSQPLTPSTGGAAVPAEPATPCPSNTPEAATSRPSTSPQPPATGGEVPTAQTFSNTNNAVGGASTPAPASHSVESAESSWERPTEWTLGIVALIAIAASALLMVRRRHE